ncbi:thioredoxin domain-containing protein, partial [Cutibacterium acnes]
EIDLQKLEQDIQNQAALQQLQIDDALVNEYKVVQTPTIMVEGTRLENPFDYQKIASLIEEKLNEDPNE